MLSNKVNLPALIILGMLSTPSYSEVVSDRIEAITQSLSIAAKSATVKKSANSGKAVLTIKAAAHSLATFSPSTATRSIPVSALNKKHFLSIFENTDIPAVITWKGKYGESGSTVSARLISINEKTGIFSFNLTSTQSISPVHSEKGVYAGKPLTFGLLKDATIFLADQQGRVIRSDFTHTSPPPVHVGLLHELGSWLIKPANADTIGSCVIQPFTYCQGADLNYANLSGADLYGADLAGAMIGWANLTGADFTYANLGVGVNVYGTYGVNMTNSTISGADFFGANLAESFIGYNTAISTQFYSANLTGSNFVASNVTGSNFTNANLSGVTMSTATGCGTTTPVLSLSTYGCLN